MLSLSVSLIQTKRVEIIKKMLSYYRIAEIVEFVLYLALYFYQNVIKAFAGLIVSSSTDPISGSWAVKWILIITLVFHILWMTPLAASVFLAWSLLTSCKLRNEAI